MPRPYRQSQRRLGLGQHIQALDPARQVCAVGRRSEGLHLTRPEQTCSRGLGILRRDRGVTGPAPPPATPPPRPTVRPHPRHAPKAPSPGRWISSDVGDCWFQTIFLASSPLFLSFFHQNVWQNAMEETDKNGLSLIQHGPHSAPPPGLPPASSEGPQWSEIHHRWELSAPVLTCVRTDHHSWLCLLRS